MLERATWQAAAAQHAAAVEVLTAGHRTRREQGASHPVEDFLFTYYRHSPAQLRRWHPGEGVGLAEASDAPQAGWRHYREVDGVVSVDVAGFVAARAQAVTFVRDLLSATLSRPAHLGCFGLHEWAMVHGLQPGERRHEALPLRLTQAETDDVVERHAIRCSHHDAYRFFTDSARDLNHLRPTRDGQVAMEQPGCLHAGMDVYKWAFKLTPLVPSSLTLDAFVLAREIRELDMAASPYDVSDLGVTAVPIETPAGKATYIERQRAFTARSNALRRRLLAVCESALAATAAA